MYHPQQPDPRYPQPQPRGAIPGRSITPAPSRPRADEVYDVPLVRVAEGALIRFDYRCTGRTYNAYTQRYELPRYIQPGTLARVDDTPGANQWRDRNMLVRLDGDANPVLMRSSMRVTVLVANA